MGFGVDGEGRGVSTSNNNRGRVRERRKKEKEEARFDAKGNGKQGSQANECWEGNTVSRREILRVLDGCNIKIEWTRKSRS